MEEVGRFPEAKAKGAVEQAILWRSGSLKRSAQDWELIGESQPWEKKKEKKASLSKAKGKK